MINKALRSSILSALTEMANEEAHSDQIADALKSEGWKADKDGKTFTKKLKGYEAAGSFSDGTRNVTLEFDKSYRYLSRVDGWGKTIKDVDLRNYRKDPKGAIAKVLENK